MGKASAPAAPDYSAAAQQTAAGNLENTRLTTKANRVNYTTPYGDLTYSQTPGDQDQWNANVSLDPTQQSLLDQQNKSAQGLGALQDAAVGRVGQAMNSPYPDAYDPTKATNNATDLLMARLNPQLDRDQAGLENKLINQGFQRGSEGFDSELAKFGQTRNDAYNQAALQGINLGQSQQQQQYNQGLMARNAPINDLNALRTGSQVTNPTFQNSPQQQYTAGADYLGAANSGYNAAMQGVNAQNANSSALMGGLFSLGGAALGAPAGGILSKFLM